MELEKILEELYAAGYGQAVVDRSVVNGAPIDWKTKDISKAKQALLAWRATAVVEALEKTIDWFMEHDGKLPPNIKATCLSELTNERKKE